MEAKKTNQSNNVIELRLREINCIINKRNLFEIEKERLVRNIIASLTQEERKCLYRKVERDMSSKKRWQEGNNIIVLITAIFTIIFTILGSWFERQINVLDKALENILATASNAEKVAGYIDVINQNVEGTLLLAKFAICLGFIIAVVYFVIIYFGDKKIREYEFILKLFI